MNDYISTPLILERLRVERDALVARVEGIPADLRDRRPGPNRWSIAEVLEHLTRVEIGVTKLLTLRGQDAPPPGSATPDDLNLFTPAIANLIRDRSKRIEAPERVQPVGALSAQAALAHLKTTRAGMLAAFLSANVDALDQLTHPHPAFGPLSLRSWVALAADHEARHAEQIGEIAEQLRAQHS